MMAAKSASCHCLQYGHWKSLAMTSQIVAAESPRMRPRSARAAMLSGGSPRLMVPALVVTTLAELAATRSAAELAALGSFLLRDALGVLQPASMTSAALNPNNAVGRILTKDWGRSGGNRSAHRL